MKDVRCLSSNALKLIGCLFMTIDHVGYMLFPSVIFLRILGRLAFPLFFFTLAEGCYYTKNRLKHLLLPTVLGIVMQVVLYFATGMTDFSIFLVFACSIVLIDLFEDTTRAVQKKNYPVAAVCALLFLAAFAGFLIVTQKTPYFVSNYNFFGILTPLLFYISKKYLPQSLYILCDLPILLVGILLSARTFGNYLNLYALFAFVFLFLYNGTRGKSRIKYFFYFYYPFHMVAIYAISLLLV